MFLIQQTTLPPMAGQRQTNAFFVVTCTFFLLAGKVSAQAVSIENMKSIYSLKDSICITVINTTISKVYYSISLQKKDLMEGWTDLRTDVFSYSKKAITRKARATPLLVKGRQQRCFYPSRYIRVADKSIFRIEVYVTIEGKDQPEKIDSAPFTLSN